MGFIVYQMDVKSAFLYGKIEKEVYVKQPPGFIDLEFPNKVYKVEKALYGLHQAPKAWYETLSTYLLENGYRRGSIDKTLFIKKDKGDIISMIGSLMYLTSSRPDIMFAVCNCAMFQVSPKTSHLYVVKRIFRYLKGQPKLGLWYPRDSPFELQAFTDSDYAGASLDRKSTTGAEYVAAANCYGQVLLIQNQMLDHGFNFMNTRIYIDNEATICIVKNPMFHSKTKHIEIRHHFIRDSYEKRLIQIHSFRGGSWCISVVDYTQVLFGLNLEGINDDQLLNTAGLSFYYLKKLCTAGLLDAAGHKLVLPVDFISSSMIHYALTVSPTIYASYIEQFWTTAKSQTVNSVKQIHAIVDGKAVVILESLVRNDLLFDDEDTNYLPHK
ncbi:putative ribonuclease H-like domain-containing protein [Tanacetum coccineum]